MHVVGPQWTSLGRVPKYALYLLRQRGRGSRREVLRNLLWYRRFLGEVRPEVIHVQHPLERCLYVRMVQQLEGWRVPLVVTAHSLFGEHAEETIYGLMAPNLRAADRVIAVGEHIAEQAISLGVAPDRVTVIRSGVDVERFRPRDRQQARRRLANSENVDQAPRRLANSENLEQARRRLANSESTQELRAEPRELSAGGQFAAPAGCSGIGENVQQARSEAASRPSRISPKPHLAEGDALVLFVGNLEPRKQVDVLLHAMRCVRQQVPHARLLIVGSGHSAGAADQTKRLIGLRHDLDLDEAVTFVGRVDDQQLLDYYAAANVFALPSSSEAQGIVALEAMACALPVVATAVGGLLGTIRDGQTGFLVPSGRPEPLAERLVELLQDPRRAESIGLAARQSVERDFAWPRTVERTIQVYREVLACAAG